MKNENEKTTFINKTSNSAKDVGPVLQNFSTSEKYLTPCDGHRMRPRIRRPGIESRQVER
jgi:hypothetical protein